MLCEQVLGKLHDFDTTGKTIEYVDIEWHEAFKKIHKKTTDKGTIIQMPMEKQDLHLFVFDPAKKAIIAEVPQTSVSKTILLDGEWSFDLKPSLNNKFGDFHWPATDELLGAYIYKARYNQVSSETADWQSPSFDDSGWKSQTFTYGTKFMILEATPELSEKELLTHLPYQSNRVQIDNKKYAWKPYEYSWRWGVENDYGHQGWIESHCSR